MDDPRHSKSLFSKEDLQSASQTQGYFESLLHQHNNYNNLEGDSEEMIRENELNFIQGYQSPTGPMKYMSKEAKAKVHAEVDIRMQELEDTGLTRNEILFEQQEGLRLADDPFFQFLKNNKTAREMLMKPGEEFTADRVIELALRQDVGPDGSLSMNRQNYKLADDSPTWEYKKKYRDNSPVLDSSAYFADHNSTERRRRLFEFD